MTKIPDNGKMSKNALIIFTREPVPGKTKTRLMPYLSPQQCADLHLCFLRDIYREAYKTGADIIVSYDGEEPVLLKSVFGNGCRYIRQQGDGLGTRMALAIGFALDLGYEKAVLIGTDIPEIRADSLADAFKILDEDDLVIGPTEDGGYYLIGMKKLYNEAFNVRKYGGSSVLNETLQGLKDCGISAGLADAYQDMDEREDLAGYRRRMIHDIRLRNSHTGIFLRDNAAVSIIIPVYNEASTIRRMISQMEPYKDDAEILFVDGGSTDGTAGIIEEVFPVLTGTKGRAAQMNRGAAESTGDILLFLHCDSILPPDITGEVRRCMAGHEYGCFGVRFPSRNLFMFTNRVISNHRAWMRGLPFGDQGIFISRELFFDMGGFPEIPIMEDYEFGRKLKAAGIRPGRTEKRITTSARRYGKGTLSILRTEFSMWKLRKMYRNGMPAEEVSRRYRDIR